MSKSAGFPRVLKCLRATVCPWRSSGFRVGLIFGTIKCRCCHFLPSQTVRSRPRLFAELPIPLWQLQLCFQRLLLVLDLLDPLQKRAQRFLETKKINIISLSSPPFTQTQWLLCQALHLEDANGIHSIPNLGSVKRVESRFEHWEGPTVHWLLSFCHSWSNSI